MVERNLPKVDVAGSSPVIRSKSDGSVSAGPFDYISYYRYDKPFGKEVGS